MAPSGVGYALGIITSLLKVYSCRGRKLCPSQPGVQVAEYGGLSKINDTIGVLLDFKDTVGTLTFYRNGVSLFSQYSPLKRKYQLLLQ